MPDIAMIKKWFEKDMRAPGRDEWIKEVNESNQIRDNTWKPRKEMKDLDGYLFKVNFHQKTVDLINGKMFGTPVSIVMEGVGKDDHLNAEAATAAIKYARRINHASKKEQQLVEHIWWDGLGVINTYWDSEEWNAFLPTGVPKYEVVDPRTIVPGSDAKQISGTPSEGGLTRLHRVRSVPVADARKKYNIPEGDVLTGDNFVQDGELQTNPNADAIIDPPILPNMTIIETQYLQEEWRRALPLVVEDQSVNFHLQTFRNRMIENGFSQPDDAFVAWDSRVALQVEEWAQNTGLGVGFLKRLIISKRLLVAYRVVWTPNRQTFLEAKRPIVFRKGMPGKFTYQLFPFRERRGRIYSLPATFYSKELFFLIIYWYTMLFADAKKTLSPGGAYIQEVVNQRDIKDIRAGKDILAAVSGTKMQEFGYKNVHDAFRKFEHKGLNPMFLQMGQILREEWHEQNYSSKEQTGKAAFSGAPAALQDMLQQAGHVPLIPFMNNVKFGLEESNMRLFEILEHLPPNTQIKIHGPKKEVKFLNINQPVAVNEIIPFMQENREAFKNRIKDNNLFDRFLRQDETGEEIDIDHVLDLPEPDGDFIFLNSIDGFFDVVVGFETNTVIEKRNRATVMVEWHREGLVDRETVIASNPDIKDDPQEVIRRIDAEKGVDALRELLVGFGINLDDPQQLQEFGQLLTVTLQEAQEGEPGQEEAA